MIDYYAWPEEKLERLLRARAGQEGEEFRIEQQDGVWYAGFWDTSVPTEIAPRGARSKGADAVTRHKALADFAALLEITDTL